MFELSRLCVFLVFSNKLRSLILKEKCQYRHKFSADVSKSPQFSNPTQYHDLWPTPAPNIATNPEHYMISTTFCAHRLNIATIRYPPTQYRHIEKYLLGLATSARIMSQYRLYFGVRLNIATICHPRYLISPHSRIPTRINHLCQDRVSI